MSSSLLAYPRIIGVRRATSAHNDAEALIIAAAKFGG
jgi:hypothetical protein